MKALESRHHIAELEFVRDEVDIGPGGSKQGCRNEVTITSK